MCDMIVYGLWLACMCLASFTLVLFGFGNGQDDIGTDCNISVGDNCRVVFRARATTFASLTWFALFLAWEMLHMRRSFFRMQPKSKLYFTQWFHDVWRNQFLFWSIVGGIVTMFPILYIPGLNTTVFKHAPISWEWGIVFVESVLFFAGIEAWKFAKRIYYRKRAKKAGASLDLETRTFGHYFTQSKSDNDESGPDAEKAKGSPASPSNSNANSNGISEKKTEV